MAQRFDANLLKFFILQIEQYILVDVVVKKRIDILRKTEVC